MTNQSIRKMSIFLTTLLFLILNCPGVKAGPLAFKDNKGKIVNQGQDYVIRMFDTPGSAIKTAEALFTVKASPDAIYKVVIDYGHYSEFMPNIVKSSILEKSDSTAKGRFKLKIALFSVEYTLSFKSDISHLPYSVTWNFIQGDIKDTTGSWLIDKEGKGTSVVHYTVHTDPGRYVPGWIANKLSSESIHNLITAIRKRTENAHPN